MDADLSTLSTESLYRRWEATTSRQTAAILAAEADRRGFDLIDAARELRDGQGLSAATIFRAELHPRGRDGKFIEQFGFVNLFDFKGRDSNGDAVELDNKRGRVKEIKGGRLGREPEVTVELFDKYGEPTRVTVDVKPRNIEQAPVAKARLTPGPVTTRTFQQPEPRNLTPEQQAREDRQLAATRQHVRDSEALLALPQEDRPEAERQQVIAEREQEHRAARARAARPEEGPPVPPQITGWVSPGTKGTGTKDAPLETDNVEDAAKALTLGMHVELVQPKQVSTLLERLAAEVKAAKEAGGTLDINLCNVTAKGTNLFCTESKGIPRIKMPQLKRSGIDPNSRAARELKPDDKGEYDIQPQFAEHLKELGYTITPGSEKAYYLKASQNELNGAKVAGMMEAILDGKSLGNEPLFVSQDDYIVDGHHRWAATVGADWYDGHPTDLSIPVERVDTDIITLLDLANKFADEWGLHPLPAGANEPPVAQRLETLREEGLLPNAPNAPNAPNDAPNAPAAPNRPNASTAPNVTFTAAAPLAFINARDRMDAKYKPNLTPHKLDEFGPGKIEPHLSQDGLTGYAVNKPTGEIVNVFALPGHPKGSGQAAMLDAIDNGGTFTNNFDGFLNSYYKQFGFTERSRIKWDDQYAPAGWNYDRDDSPDVLEMQLPVGWTRDDAERSLAAATAAATAAPAAVAPAAPAAAPAAPVAAGLGGADRVAGQVGSRATGIARRPVDDRASRVARQPVGVSQSAVHRLTGSDTGEGESR